MKRFFADTNFYLRFILKDNNLQAVKVKNYLKKAKNGQVKIIFSSPVILEMEFVLRSVYSVSRKRIAKCLMTLVKTNYLEIEEREIWLKALETYIKKNFSLFDFFIFFKAKKENAQVLSFDKDFKKLKKFIK